MTRRAWAVVVMLLVCSLGHVAKAATPSLMNYQGILTDGLGTPQVGGPFTVTFSMYDDATATNGALWSETQPVTTDSEGRFNVLLGSISPLTDAVFSEASRWLGTTVGPDVSDLLPRTQIVTVAYAFRAATLDHAVLGTDRTFIGQSAGNSTMTGFANTGSGTQALSSTTTGFQNTANGANALQNNTTGRDNTAMGSDALQVNSTGDYNTATGEGALRFNTDGSSNTANGDNALVFNTTGNQNTAIGALALSANTVGNYNTASGFGALQSNTIGVHNTATGHYALFRNIDGYSNTANGISALYNNNNGGENTAIGMQTLFSNTTGGNNTAIGFNALIGNTTGISNTASGREALGSNTTGFYNTACGVNALLTNVTGDSNTAIGFGADVSSGNLTNATAIGARALVDASNKIRLGDTNITVIEGQVAYTFTSDKQAKENFQPVDGDEVLRKLRTMSLTSWNYKGHDPDKQRHYGPMAQEFFEAFGHDGVGASGTPTTINSGDQAGILMIAVQALEKRNAELESTVRALSARLEQVERTSSSSSIQQK